MKYILWKKLKTKSVNEFDSEDIKEVVDYCKAKGYKFIEFSYFGGFACFTNGKHTFSIQGQHLEFGVVLGYEKSIFNGLLN